MDGWSGVEKDGARKQGQARVGWMGWSREGNDARQELDGWGGFLF